MKSRRPKTTPRPRCEPLDPRRLLSADPAATVDLSLLAATFDSTHLDARYISSNPTAPLSATVRNWADTSAAFRLRVSVGLGTTPDPAHDVPVGVTGPLTIPAGTVQAFNLTLALPPSFRLPPGDYHVFVRTDANPDVTPADNVLLVDSPFLVRPDFWPTFTVYPPDLTVGTSRDVAVMVYDTGNAPDYGFRTAVNIYISSDLTLDPSDIPLQPVSVNVFGSAGPVTFHLPTNLPVGTYYPIAVVDPLGIVPELDKSNNVLARAAFTVLPPGDLVPTSLQLSPPFVHPGQRVTSSLAITTAGLPVGQSFGIRYVLTDDDVVGQGDILLGQFTHVPSLGPGGVTTFNDQITIPDYVPLGNYRLAAILNPDHALAESDFANDSILGPQINVRRTAPDLTPAGPVIELAPDSFGWNPPTTEFAISDLAQVPDGNYAYVSLYLSSDAALSPDDTLLANTWYAHSTTTPFMIRFQSLPIPATLGTTWYPIAAVTLSTDIDPSNNVTVGQPFTTPAARSLSVVSIDTNGVGRVVPGSSIETTATVAAAGYFPSDSFTIRYYLTADATIDPSDTLLGTQTGSIHTGPSSTPVLAGLPSHGMGIPSSTPVGTYHLAAVVEGYDAAPVLATNDIVVAAPDPSPTAGPTLTPTDVQLPTFHPNDYVYFSVPVTNDSDLGAWNLRYNIYLSTDPTLSPDDALAYSSYYDGVLYLYTPATLTGAFPLPVSPGTYYPIVALDPDQLAPDADRSNNVAVGSAVSIVNRHFTLLSLSVPATVNYRAPFTVTATARVTGFSRYDTPVNVGLSFNNGTTAFVLDTTSVDMAALESGNPVDVSFQFTATPGTQVPPPGTYTLLASPSWWGDWPTGQSTSVDPSFVPPTVNITAASYFLSLSAPTYTSPVYYNEPVTFSFTVSNLGAEPSSATTVSLSVGNRYAWPYGWPTNPPTPLDPIAIDPIPAFSSRTITVTRTLPSYSWDQAILFSTDSSQDASFSPSYARTASLPIQPSVHWPETPPYIPPTFPSDPGQGLPIDFPPVAVPPAVDLSLFSVSSPAAVTAGSTLRLFTTPTVAGQAGSAPFYISVVLSADDTFGGPDDIPLGWIPFDALPVGTAPQSQSALRVPPGTPAGTYRLFAVADVGQDVTETNEENNLLAANNVTVLAPTLAGSLTIPDGQKFRTGSPAQFRLSLTNRTKQTVRRTYGVTYYLSYDPYLTPDDVPFSRQTIDTTLAGKQTRTFPMTARIPSTGPLRIQWVVAAVDALTGKSPAAHVEVASDAIFIYGPHLTPSILSVRATNRTDTAKVTVRLLNDGTAPSTAPVTLRLLADNTQLLTTKKSVTLKPGKYVDYTFTVRRSPLSTFAVTLV